MARVYISSVIEAPVARVWEKVRDFNCLLYTSDAADE